MKKTQPFFYTLLLILIASSSFSQNEITGKVKDGKDSTALNSVSIYIPDLKLTAITNSDGTYSIKNIPNGTFLIQVTLVGYATQVREVNIKESAKVDFTLNRSSKELSEVIVTGVSSATEQQSNPIPVNVVTHNDILQNGSTNIIDAISISPGVSEMTLGPNISKPFIRGLGYNRVITANDGVRQEGQQWFDEFGEEIDEYSVDKVEILKGPASLSYGSDAMAGVINMIAAPPLQEGQIKGNILANYQTNNGLIAGSANLAGNIKGFIWDVRYSNKMAHCYQNKYDGYVANSGYSESNLKAMVGVNRKWGYSHLTVSSFDMKLGIIEGARDSATGKFQQHFLVPGPGDSLGIAPESGFTKYNNFPVIHQHVRHYKAVLDNSFALGDGRLNVRVGLQQNYRQEANDITYDGFNNYFFLQTLNYDVRYVLPEKNHFELSIGANGMQQNSEDRGTAFVLPEYSLFDIGAFVIAKKTFNKLSVSGGLRYDTRTLKGKDLYVDSAGVRQPGPTSTTLTEFSAYSSNFSGFSGSLGLTYDFTKSIYGKLNIARGYRAPSAQESGSNGIHDGTPFFEIGDHNLKAESSLEVDGTLGANAEDISIEGNVFMNQINNYIFAEKLASVFGGDSMRSDPALPPDVGTGPAFKYVQGNAMLTGGEVILDIHPHKLSWLHFENSFSMVNAIQKNQPDSTKYLPYTPPNKYRSELKFVFRKAGNSFKNTFVKFGIDYYFEQDHFYKKFGNETVTPAYTLFNAGIGTDVCSKTRTLFSVYIYGSNLGDVAYQSSMSRLKYTDPNNVTGRIGVYNMGRSISFKLLIPIDIKK
ncbi:MAG: TonB-dependent receptor [Bacteroidia bacterium]